MFNEKKKRIFEEIKKENEKYSFPKKKKDNSGKNKKWKLELIVVKSNFYNGKKIESTMCFPRFY